MAKPSLSRSLLDALDEPALIVGGGRVDSANSAALRLLGRGIEGGDVRLAIRHPQALDHILAGRAADLDIIGIGAPDRPWTVQVRPLGGGQLLVRLADRSAARAAERMRVDFVANASHELRTPLTSILGYAETLADDGQLDPEVHAKFGAIIRTEARRMLRIVEDLMSLSRIEADRFVAPRDRIDPAELVRLAVEQARPLAETKDARIALELDEALPEIRGDQSQLLQLLDNLIANAIRYGCTGSSCVVQVGVRRETDTLLLSVKDNGDGIAPQHLPRLTERFYRVDEARSRDSGGTGLGLAIVKHIVERHRGALDIRSHPGRGTQVSVRLPISSTGSLS